MKGKVIVFCQIMGIKHSRKVNEEEEIIQSAKALTNILKSEFAVSDVRLRAIAKGCIHEGLISTTDPQTVFAVLGDDDIAGTVEYIEMNSASPVLSAKTGDELETFGLRIAKSVGLYDAYVLERIKRYLERRRQSILVSDIQLRTRSPRYLDRISSSNNTISGAKISLDDIPKRSGKVRDSFDLGDRLALVTTDRQSGFDRILALVPYKGAVLNLTSAYWFEATKGIIPNHLLGCPHPNVSLVKKCTPFPVEFVVRAYMTGSTNTSIWKNYLNGVRNYCGHNLPEGLVKNQKLPQILLTPTTKEETHDRPISGEEIVSTNLMSESDYKVCAEAALALFSYGQRIASQHGLILVDTKYEMGKDHRGNILLIDEIHTPDSSRYWIASSYESRMASTQEPENIDKEFLRLWFAKHCDPYKDDVLPHAPKDLVVELSRRYISLYEMITLKEFEFGGEESDDVEDVIAGVIKKVYDSLQKT